MLPVNLRWHPTNRPWVIAHRGASGLLPEHCLPGYALAIEQGADVIEPDLVASRDGVLYARHDLGLARSTDIASRPEFATLRRAGPDGQSDWWIADLDSAQVDTLRVIQPWPQRPHHRDGVFRVPRFSEVLALLMMERQRRERPLLVYPELKHPQYFLDLGIDLVELLVGELQACGLNSPQAPLLVQCFDSECLHRVRLRTGLRVVQLATDLPDLGSQVDGYGIAKTALEGPAGRAFIDAAHARGRLVHAWTFRDDQPHPQRSKTDEYRHAFLQGCDGVFSDFPATALLAREALAQKIEQLSTVRIECVVGEAIKPYLDDLAHLRIKVFRDWPYCYDGDLAYEADYLAAYSCSPHALFVLAFAGERIIGCSTGMPMRDETAAIQAPFHAAGFNVDQIFYFGESVLDSEFRGLGLGHRFFDAREAFARSLPGIRNTAFCAVERAADDPRRPNDHRSLNDFWRDRGYKPYDHLRAQLAWKECGAADNVMNTMVFWLRGVE